MTIFNFKVTPKLIIFATSFLIQIFSVEAKEKVINLPSGAGTTVINDIGHYYIWVKEIEKEKDKGKIESH